MIRPDTVQRVAERRNGSLRKLAQELGFPPSFAASLSDVLHERHENVGLRTENRIRVALGLDPIAVYEVPPCPDCGLVHTGRCRGKRGEVAIVGPDEVVVKRARRRTVKRWRDLPVGELARAIRDRVEYKVADNYGEEWS